MSDWSSRVSVRFNLNLPADVVAWFDGELWKEASETGFFQPEEPESLLDPKSYTVMGGLMLPDTLPILGNGCGDVLCLLFNSRGTVSEVVRWLHEGGDWTPYGASLCEALLFDAAIALTEELSPNSDHRLEEIGFAGWALDWLESTGHQSDIRQLLRKDDGLSIMGFLEAGVAETAVHCLLCQCCLTSELLKYCQAEGGNQLATKLGVPWPEFSRWLFDTALVPEKMKRKLAKATRVPIDELFHQDWRGAVREAEAVAERRSDLTWPFAVLGWAAERQGDHVTAVERYTTGLTALGTASDFTENWGDFPPQKTKFVVDRLKELRDALPPEVLENDFLKTALESKHGADFFHHVRKHWCDRAALAEEEGRYADAYRSYYHAGWDILVLDDIEILLDGMERNAKAAGWPALASIASHHRECSL